MQRMTTCPLKPTQLPKTPIIKKNQNINFEPNISEKLKGYAKIDKFDTFYETFLEIKYSTRSKLENFKEENEKSRSLETKIQFYKLKSKTYKYK